MTAANNWTSVQNRKENVRIVLLETCQQSQTLRGITVPRDNFKGGGAKNFKKGPLLLSLLLL